MTDTTDQQAVTVAQEDREAAANLVIPNGRWPGFPSDFRSGRADRNELTQAFARHREQAIASVSPATAIKASAEVSLMYLQTGFIECPQCGEEVPTKELDAAYELATVIEPAPTIGGTVRPEPVPATNQAGEVERARELAIKYALPGTYDGISSYATRQGDADDAPYMHALLAALATQPATSQGKVENGAGKPETDADDAEKPATSQEGEGITLYREIDALGGTSSSKSDEGYNKALSDVLWILTKRGFTDYADFDPTEEGSGLDPRTPAYGVGR